MINKGHTEEEAEALDQKRIETLKASRARTMALRKEKDGLSAGLGDGVVAAIALRNTKKELNREFRVNPNKGVLKPSTVNKKVLSRQRKAEKERELQLNPRIKGLAGMPGIEVDEDGTIGLVALREQRPDIFKMKPQPTDEGKIKIALHKRAKGLKDRYGYVLEPDYTPRGS